ncbi:MAG TPA: conjugal transfer protein TraD [Sphingomonadaceae bacterium]|nr:conjugal transfer protein TraD [Sphingomonadaceae bacterium]
MKRRERTRQLIELGGLVAKARLVELTDDDRAMILGALLDVATRLGDDDADTVKTLWRRRGKRAFAQNNDERATG